MKTNELCNCFILRKGASNLTFIYDKALSSTGIRVTQYVLLKYIYLLNSPNLNKLATALNQNRSTVGRNIKILERIKLVYLKTGKDKRQIEIILTEFGLDTLHKAREAWEVMNKIISFKLGKEKQKQLIELMNDIKAISL